MSAVAIVAAAFGLYMLSVCSVVVVLTFLDVGKRRWLAAGWIGIAANLYVSWVLLVYLGVRP